MISKVSELPIRINIRFWDSLVSHAHAVEVLWTTALFGQQRYLRLGNGRQLLIQNLFSNSSSICVSDFSLSGLMDWVLDCKLAISALVSHDIRREVLLWVDVHHWGTYLTDVRCLILPQVSLNDPLVVFFAVDLVVLQLETAVHSTGVIPLLSVDLLHIAYSEIIEDTFLELDWSRRNASILSLIWLNVLIYELLYVASKTLLYWV